MNPDGINQLSPHGYGEKKKVSALKRSAPISGAPMVAGALNAAQENQRRAVRGQPSPRQAPAPSEPQGMSGAPPLQPTPEAALNAIRQQLLSIPGVDPIIGQLR